MAFPYTCNKPLYNQFFKKTEKQPIPKSELNKRKKYFSTLKTTRENYKQIAAEEKFKRT